MKSLKITCSLVFSLFLTSCLENNISTLGSSSDSSNGEESYEWVEGDWGGCSATQCGTNGTQLRVVVCRDSDGNDVADSNCLSQVGAKPETSRSCSASACQSCTLDGVTVAHGQSRNFYNTGSVACGSTCPTPVSRTCNNGSLSGSSSYNKASCSVNSCSYTYSWQEGSWGACSTNACGTTGTQTRTVSCRRSDNQVVTDSLCITNVGPKPATSQGCTNGPCTNPGNFSWVMGFDTTAPTNMSMPALNTPYIDSAYGVKVSRVAAASQVNDKNIPSWVRHEYSRRPAFNSDSTKALMISSNGWLRLYNVNKADNTMTFVKTLNVGGSIEPNWHPTNPDLFYYIPNGKRIMSYNVTNDQTAVAGDLTGKIPFGPSDSRIWTKEEGRPSDDGRIWCFMVEKYNNSTQTTNHYGIVAYNLETDQVIGSLEITARPDHISTSPKGNYCVPSWDSSQGTRAYKTDFSSFKQLHTKSEHSDLAVDKNGNEIYVFSDYQSGDVAMVDMATGARTNLFRLYGPSSSGTAMHFSGIGTKHKPGYVVVSFYACGQNYGNGNCDPALQWFKDKIIIVELNANPKIYNVAHSQYGSAGYFGETQAVANNDLSKILFVSSWRTTSESNLSSYMIDVPVSSLP